MCIRDSSKDETTEGLLAKTSVTPALQGCDVASGNCVAARVTSNKTGATCHADVHLMTFKCVGFSKPLLSIIVYMNVLLTL